MFTLTPVLLALGGGGCFTSSEGMLLSTCLDSNPDLSDGSAVVCPALMLRREKICLGFGGPPGMWTSAG